MHDPLRLPVCVRPRQIRPPERMGDHDIKFHTIDVRDVPAGTSRTLRLRSCKPAKPVMVDCRGSQLTLTR